MTNNDQVSQTIIEDIQSKYDEQIHIPLLIAVLSRGEGIEAFCDEADICETTFKEWRKRHPKFKKAYDRGLMRGKRRWMSLPFHPDTREGIDFRPWMLVARNRYGFGKHEIEEADSDEFPDKARKLQEALIQKDIDPLQYSAIMSGYHAEIKAQREYLQLQKERVPETTPIARMNETEIKEELKEFVAEIKEELAEFD